ncbi:MAG TPA: response regulator, partial [Vicinamibacterales bacterium]|nr:response regulator [Vicinamibacterales bacterium]
VSRRILASLLESAGVKVITATGGVEGVSLAMTHRPDIIFMDVRMADLDGFTATMRLGQNAVTKDIPVIAVTASAMGDMRSAAREAGCVDYLPKPVRAESLFAAMRKELGVLFVWEKDETQEAERPIAVASRHADLAPRLREAVEIGAVTDLQVMAVTLSAGDDVDVALGKRIAALAAGFDFDGVRELAASLEAAGKR